MPSFLQQFVLWEVVFQNTLNDICDLTIPGAPTFFNAFPALMRNPSQDYDHLKQRRADIQALGYSGIRAPSSRSTQAGSIVAIFSDQSNNVQSITPYAVDFRLITPPPRTPYNNHAQDLLDFTAGEVRIAGAPSGNTQFQNFAIVSFNH